jgi:hypothetical protein
MKDENGDKAFSAALKTRKSEDAVLKIIEQYPDYTIKVNDKLSRCPLRLACEYSHTGKVILTLLKSFPQAAAEKDINIGTSPYILSCSVR